MKINTIEGVIDLYNFLSKKYTIDLSSNLLNHILGVSKICNNISEKIYKDKTKLKMLRISGLLHDIGKAITIDLYNETHIGAYYLEEKGYKDIADTIKTHFTSKEIIELQIEKFPDEFRKKFPYILNPEDFNAITIEQKILTYADMHNRGGAYCVPEERLADIKERYGSGERYKEFPLFIESVYRGEQRLLNICKEIGGMAEDNKK